MYITQVEDDLTAYPIEAVPTKKPYAGVGSYPLARYRGTATPLHQYIADAAADPASWQQVTWREGSRGRMSGYFTAIRVRPAGRKHTHRLNPEGSLDPAWLLVQWPTSQLAQADEVQHEVQQEDQHEDPADQGVPAEPVKYWLLNLPEDTPLAELVRLGKIRWRKVDDLVAALGVASGISKSEVSRICADLDVEVAAFPDRPLGEQIYPYVFLDATYCKARVGHRVVSRAVIIATVPRKREVPPVTADGHREVLGVDVGDSEDEAFWKAFLTSLKRRGLSGVQLVISDAHEGLKRAIAKAMSGASWQRCRVHFARNLLAHVAKADGEVVTAAYRTVFAQPIAAGVQAQWDSVAATFEGTHPKVAAVMDTAREDVLAFTSFPCAHWKKIWSTNPLERLNKEVKRRTDVVGVFPNDAALLRLTSCVLIEAHDEWAAGDRRYLSEASMAALNGTNIAALPAITSTATTGSTGIDTEAAMTA